MDRVGGIHNVLRRCQTGLTGISAKKRAFSFSTLGQSPLEKTAHLRILPKFCPSFAQYAPDSARAAALPHPPHTGQPVDGLQTGEKRAGIALIESQ